MILLIKVIIRLISRFLEVGLWASGKNCRVRQERRRNRVGWLGNRAHRAGRGCRDRNHCESVVRCRGRPRYWARLCRGCRIRGVETAPQSINRNLAVGRPNRLSRRFRPDSCRRRCHHGRPRRRRSGRCVRPVRFRPGGGPPTAPRLCPRSRRPRRPYGAYRSSA